MNMQPMLSVSDVAVIVGMTEGTVRQAIREGQLRASKLRGRIRIEPTEVDAWINDSTIIPQPLPSTRQHIDLVVPRLATAATPENIDALIAQGRRRAA